MASVRRQNPHERREFLQTCSADTLARGPLGSGLAFGAFTESDAVIGSATSRKYAREEIKTVALVKDLANYSAQTAQC